MNESVQTRRAALVRETIVFQLKLVVDGVRDLVLIPVSLIASLMGLMRGGDEPEREFRQVLQIGRDSEQWINLFGSHAVPEDANATASIDALFSRVEETLKQQYQASGISAKARSEIDAALQVVHDKVKQKQPME